MELAKSGGDTDIVRQLENLCSLRGLPQPKIQETVEYPYTYVAIISVGVGMKMKKAMCRGQSARSAKEKAAFKWMQLYGHSQYQDIQTFPPERNSSASVSSPRNLNKSTGPSAKSNKTKGKGEAAIQLQVDAAWEDGTSEDDDPGEPKDPGKKTLLKRVFGNSPLPKQNPFKGLSSSKKSVREKTSYPVDSDDEHQSPPPKKSSTSKKMKKKIFSVFTESPKKGKSEKAYKFQFKRDQDLPDSRNGEEVEEKKTHRKASLQQSSPPKVNIEGEKYEQSSIDLGILQLLESSSDSEIPQSPGFRGNDRGGRSGEVEVVDLSSDPEFETPTGLMESQMEPDETVGHDEDLFDSLRIRFSLPIRRKKDPSRVQSEISGSGKILKQTGRVCPPTGDPEKEKEEHLFKSPLRKAPTLRKERSQDSPVMRKETRRLPSPTIDELLKLPEKVGNTGKTMDQILDEGNF